MTQIDATDQLTSPAPDVVTGVQLMRGIGARPAKGFWADAWSQVIRRRAAVLALCWVGLVAFFAVFAPVLANGHPLVLRTLGPDGAVESVQYPLFEFLTAVDVVLLLGALVGLPIAWFAGTRGRRAARLKTLAVGAALALAVTVPVSLAENMIAGRNTPAFLSWVPASRAGPHLLAILSAIMVACVALAIPTGVAVARRAGPVLVACAIGATVAGTMWSQPLDRFDYVQREVAGEVRATYTLVPWSPTQRFSELDRRPPGTKLGGGLGLPPDSAPAPRTFVMGTDAFGSDVFTQVLHACRLSISIGVVSTGIALLIGVTMGALMGYFGGWVDLLLYRVVEVFMAVPVLFLLIVAVAVIPREFQTTYTLMAIIGCFTWTGMARFTRAEFLKLRNQDFVQSARAVGLPLRSVLFKHMLPNGVAPVLVDTSFAIAAAITIEAVLSYLGLGPVDQASWGKLLASAMNPEGEFKWWLAVFPGVAIFLTVLSYNMIGETLRDAIDPKLKKARV